MEHEWKGLTQELLDAQESEQTAFGILLILIMLAGLGIFFVIEWGR